MIHFENINVLDERSGQRLTDFNLRIERGQNVVVMGPEGSGKQLFIDLLNGIRRPDSGKLWFNQTDISTANEQQLEKIHEQIGHISYNYALMNNLSVFENIILPLRYHTKYSEWRLRLTGYRILKTFQLFEVRNLRPVSLNLNQLFRTAFVRAIVKKPQLVLLDHVIQNQCPLANSGFFDLARSHFESPDTTYIFTTFSHEKILTKIDQIILLYDGKIVFKGSISELQVTDNIYVRQYLSDPLNGPMQTFYENLRKSV